MKPFALIILLLLPVLAVGALCLHKTMAAEVVVADVDLKAMIPLDFDGWQSVDLPLGPTEALSESANKLLDLDTFLQRRYSKNGSSMTVYVAYWKPGKTDTRLIATHSPDVCWTGNGMTCVESTNREVVEIPGITTKPAEYRVFEAGASRIRVFFWLTQNGESYDYAESRKAIPNPVHFFKTFFHYALVGKPEHYFVRISSDLPKDRLISESLFAEVLKDLRATGVIASQ
jgi:hypothetical protein